MKQQLDAYFSKYAFYLLPLVSLAVIIFLFLNNDLPLIGKFVNLRRDNSVVQEKLAGLLAKSALLSGLNQKELESQYQSLGYILPDGKDAPGILRTIDAAASSSGATIVNLDLTPGKLATESGKESEIPIKVTVSGNFSQIINFTGELINSGRALSVKTLEAIADEASSGFTASYEIRAFYLSPAVMDVLKVNNPLLEMSPNEKQTLFKALKRPLLAPQTILIPSPKTDLFK